ncbi:branched-chain amino acid ABC transporter permease [Micromonospora sp. WMMD1082]|uniref:branched-chain amino acid ABC transporter permease n=1 Tax=Micromonospora sp. WMMD1082 TaxID=3016104 RepID=UPI00241775D2|nr:branched-chain amino acid ABC transporter permease [Micromonospora sp. WMMD1082]MDG4795507.1 branched-chain amino acid ABC transporter permease [Micromonospora sp. WMMD1082]
MSAIGHAAALARLRPLSTAMPAALAVVAVVAVVVSPDPYLHATVARMLPLALLAVSVAVVTGHAGLPTLAQVAPHAVGLYATARLALAGVDLAVVHLATAAVLGAAVAGLLGLVLVRYRGTVFLMLSLAVAELTEITAAQWRAVSGGTDGLAGIPSARLAPGLPPLLADRAVLLYAAAVAVTATAAAMWLLAGDRRMLLTAARDNPHRARASGHPVTAYLWAVHTGAGALAGIAGALWIHTHRWATPRDVGFTTAALVLLAVVIGGARSLPGAALGVVIVLAVRDVVAADFPGHAPLLLGGLFVAAVYVLPGGLAALPARLRRRPPPVRRPDGPAASAAATSVRSTP